MLSVAGRIRPFFIAPHRGLPRRALERPGRRPTRLCSCGSAARKRIDRYVEHIRRAGGNAWRAPRGSWSEALSELAANSGQLSAAARSARAALSLHELGTVERLRGQWLSASTLLREALDLARRRPTTPTIRSRRFSGWSGFTCRGCATYAEAAHTWRRRASAPPAWSRAGFSIAETSRAPFATRAASSSPRPGLATAPSPSPRR